jgi:uncharacterized protein (TIGR03435 family)
MMRLLPLVFCLFIASVEGQTPPAFEVASIKPSAAEPGSASGIRSDVGRISARNMTVRGCVKSAYGLPEAQILGGPKWVDEERYDIDAKADSRAGDGELMIMLRQLLTERFQLVVHRDTKPLNGYGLVVGKKGLIAKRSEPDAQSKTSSSRRSIDATSCSMAHLASALSGVLHAPVMDATGIEGDYDIQLQWTPDELQSAVFPALEEQLGLKLEARKVPKDVIVIDSVQRPSVN